MGKESLSINEVRDMMIAVADKIIEAEPILTDADRALGEGDHGVGHGRCVQSEALAIWKRVNVDEGLRTVTLGWNGTLIKSKFHTSATG